LIQVDKHDKH